MDVKKLNEKYDLEIEKIILKIKSSNAKLVLLQFPDGLKLYATFIVNYLKEKTKAEFLIWFETCFGACDTPVLDKETEKEINLVVQFGHNEMKAVY